MDVFEEGWEFIGLKRRRREIIARQSYGKQRLLLADLPLQQEWLVVWSIKVALMSPEFSGGGTAPRR
ncbi:MAG: hypothetical protein KBC95_05030, partial [Candidatus Peribacteraceae bacterium]|nr:hypothetical protein [Candidatus Peribacteraceae bacterium]